MKRPSLLMAVISLICLSPIQTVRAHSWYPYECCSDNDCDLVTEAVFNPDGSILVTTKHGTMLFPPKFPIKGSPDGKMHACFTKDKPLCLFDGAGT